MTNKKAADPRAIVLIFSALAMALAIIIFYIWLGISGVEKQQSSINGRVGLIFFDNLLTDAIVENPSILRGTAGTVQTNLAKLISSRYVQSKGAPIIGVPDDIKCQMLNTGPSVCSMTIRTTADASNCFTYLRQVILPESRFVTAKSEPLPSKIINMNVRVCSE